MPSILSDDDKEIVKRMVPKASNKIQAVAVARLYIAYPNRAKWTYTGLQGAIVLSNDLIGNTYWLKLVDVSPANRGVIWDQEIYENWSYNQDRTYFHSFETEEYLAGLSFVDEKEARQFLKKMADREKNASKATRAKPFGDFGSTNTGGGGHKHSLLGGFFGGHRHSSAPSMQQTPPMSPQSYTLAPQSFGTQYQDNRSSSGSAMDPVSSSEFAALDELDPHWREIWGDDLRAMGITDDMIRDNQEFIVAYIREKQAGPPPIEEPLEVEVQRSKPPPPPPPPQATPKAPSISPQTTGPATTSSSSTRRGAPPAPPPSRVPKAEPVPVEREPTPPREPSPPRGPPPPRFAAPPPLPDAGKYAKSDPPSSKSRPHAGSLSNPGPPPPPRVPKSPSDDYEPGEHGSRFGVPPPFVGQRTTAPPPTPSRGPVPPPPPARGSVSHSNSHAHAAPPSNALPPPLPPKIPNAPDSNHGMPPPLPPSSSRPVPPPPARGNVPPPPSRSDGPPLPPPLPPTSSRSSHGPPSAPPLPPPSSTGAPPPPPPPPPPPFSSGPPPPPPPPPSSSGPPLPPPPPPSSSGPPPPPPPPPNRDSGYASGTPALPQPAGDRSGLMAGIKQAGGIGALKRVDRSQIRDRSAAMVPGNEDTGPHGSGLPPAGALPSPSGGGGLADALQAALSKRKQKVSASDDEASEDEW